MAEALGLQGYDAHTWYGDANLDGEFNSTDFVEVFIAGKYETEQMAGWADGDWQGDMRFNSGDLVDVFQAGKYETEELARWSEGDWSGDERFGSGDLIVAFQDGGYELGMRPAVAAVPEPSGLILLTLGLIGMRCVRRTR